MSASAYRGVADRVDIDTAAAAVTRSVPLVEDGWAGVPATSAAIGEPYVMHVEGEFDVPFVTSSTVGTIVYITAADGTLSITAGVGKRPFGKVTRVPGGTHHTVPSGRMWVKISPYVPAITQSE